MMNVRNEGRIWKCAIFFALLLSSCSAEESNDGNGKSDREPPRHDSGATVAIDDSTSGRSSVEDHRLIVPGKRIGRTRIGESLARIDSILGPPDSGDAGMGHVWQYRRSSAEEGETSHELDIYASFDEEATGHYVRQIRITSPWFGTQEGIGTGSTFDVVKRGYPNIQPVAEYEERRKHIVYDDPNEGIAFEFVLGDDDTPAECTGIVVHEPGRDVRQTYIPRHEYREIR